MRLFAFFFVNVIATIGFAQEPIRKIVFGSCIKQERPIPILFTMKKERADLLMFIGDNIYADTMDMQVMREKYNKLAANKDFQSLTSDCVTMATWDDHDYGINDAGADFPKRAESQKQFLDFWNVPADSPRRKQEGIYEARVFGPEGKRVQVIVLDTRFFRSPLKTGKRRVGGPYYPDEDASKTMLGQAQWKWLKEQLEKPAELRIIVSSIQFVAAAAGQETWSNLPLERKRFLDLIQRTKANGILFVSGDRHWAELSTITQNVPYPIHDLTSSSLNQIHSRGTPTENAFRVSPTYHRENYGRMIIDWSESPSLTMEVCDMEGTKRISKKVQLADLDFD